ncbi:MAG: hypothetical protein GXP21_04935 [Gammaproteobacteria bacterium]|nr:hypothetical protein [Gammaproteobacteria bacterium]
MPIPPLHGETDGFIDLSRSDNGEYLYPLLGLSGSLNVYKTSDNDALELIQEVRGNLPEQDTQGIAAF